MGQCKAIFISVPGSRIWTMIDDIARISSILGIPTLGIEILAFKLRSLLQKSRELFFQNRQKFSHHSSQLITCKSIKHFNYSQKCYRSPESLCLSSLSRRLAFRSLKPIIDSLTPKFSLSKAPTPSMPRPAVSG